MGGGSYSNKDWTEFSTSRGYDDPNKKTDEIYAARAIDPGLDPKGFSVRESVDGTDHPASTPVILALDVTGSMSPVLDMVAREGLKTLCEEVYKRRPITDPHICIVGIGDVEMGDKAPLQASQFEADIRIFQHLEKLYLEKGGGGNSHESYILAWYFAKYRTSTDSFRKRGVKGFLFTIGDEEITPSLTAEEVARATGDAQAKGFTAQEMYDLVYPEWNVYHIILKQGDHASRFYPDVKKSWDDVLGAQKVIGLDDYKAIGETIVSIMELMAGKTLKDVTESWDGTTKVAVGNALKEVVTSGSIDVHL